MGMDVIVCEVDPLKALEAPWEGYRVMKAEDAARFADVWVTVTGDCNVIDEAGLQEHEGRRYHLQLGPSTPRST